ncbi:MAG: ImmA/IrrE family metallo-endopeptidase, partial [Candidatus Aminicenantes bacterium]|nr:ImmA/IrrE family metallo-endopeptidase [Candidatus Aminicenantes bacterium]
YLSETPKDFDALHDFRLLWGEEEESFSPELRYEIRLANYRRDNILNLYELSNEKIPILEMQANRNTDENELSKQIRELLKIKLEDQFNLKNENQAFNFWRNAISNRGVLVFQASKISIQEMRGFSIFHSTIPVIVVNNKDSFRGRLFSMLHEFVHILLKKGGLCNLREQKKASSINQSLEVFCNLVAGAVLVPESSLLEEEKVERHGPTAEWEDNVILSLANRYMVSREVILRRLLIIGKTSQTFYEMKRQQLLNQYKDLKPRKEGHPQHYIVELSKTGHHYAKKVLTSYYQNMISASELSDYLGMKLKHLPKIEAELFF